MTLQLDLKPETERHLRAVAEARHIPVEEFVLSLVESALPAPGNAAPSERDIQEWFRELAQFSHKIPNQPGETWSRETLYDDHD